ncbi:MAG: glycosyl transferase family 2 [Alphaproteobacteria bacterium]|nr:MAG: glycosyl transferase family 2 [Alphaproteobacteria bacterium]
MILGKKIVVVLPAYQAGRTLEKTYRAIPHDSIDEVILVDDASSDDTVEVANALGIRVIVHEKNLGYGANQKTCYAEALKLGADVVVMLHPDYQYEPRLSVTLASMVASDIYDVVIGSRILGNGTKAGGMPRYKYYANRVLTFFQNVMMGAKLSEYHTGYRAFSRHVLLSIPILANSNDFVFDNEMLCQIIASKFRIGEVSCPTRYTPDASSIGLWDSIIYGIGVLKNCILYTAWKIGLFTPKIYQENPDFRLGRSDEDL